MHYFSDSRITDGYFSESPVLKLPIIYIAESRR
jgi:hypothetical protein